jgi:molybdenum cofactor cytidylyltransferase
VAGESDAGPEAIVGIVLAAGGGKRFGGLKQVAELGGRPLLDHALETMRAVPAIERIAVVLGAEAEKVRARVDLSGTEIVVAPDWEDGIAASLRAGIAALGDADAAVVTLADQPLVTRQAVAAVLDRLDGPVTAVRATYGGAPGHPVAIKRALFPEVAQLRGDLGARDLLEAHRVVGVECGHLSRAADVDTPADLDALRRSVT